MSKNAAWAGRPNLTVRARARATAYPYVDFAFANPGAFIGRHAPLPAGTVLVVTARGHAVAPRGEFGFGAASGGWRYPSTVVFRAIGFGPVGRTGHAGHPGGQIKPIHPASCVIAPPFGAVAERACIVSLLRLKFTTSKSGMCHLSSRHCPGMCHLSACHQCVMCRNIIPGTHDPTHLSRQDRNHVI